jgi:hypothetical protein
MINNKRISKLKRDIYKKVGKLCYSNFIIQAIDGLYLFEMNKGAIFHKDKYIKIDKAIDGLEIIDYKECSIDSLLIVGDGKSEPVIIEDHIPYSERIAEGYLNNSNEPFKDFSNDELKEIIVELD